MKQIFLSLLVLCAIVARAQKNYVPAIVISRQNDSLRGLVDYRNWRISPEQISFKQDMSAEEQRFKAADIAGFLIVPDNELYLSRQVQLDITVQTLDNLLSTNERIYRNDTVFLMTIVKGAYNLYSFTDRNDQPHFVYDSAGQPARELRMIRSRASDGSSAIVNIDLYKQQLEFLFAACPDVAKRARRVSYAENPLRDLFIGYHECRNPSEKIVVKAKEKLSIRWGLLAGAGFNSYNFTGGHFLAKVNYTGTTTPLPGLFIDVPVSRNRHQYWCSAEAYYKVLDASGILQNQNILGATQDQVNLKFSYAQLNLLFRYLYPKGIVRPFANLGWGNAIMISESKNERYQVDRKEDAREAVDGPRKHENTFLGGAGLQYKRLQIEARYAWSNGFSPYTSLATEIKSWQGIIRFAF
jgi:hypothetical protein